MSELEDYIDFENYTKRLGEPGPRRYLRDYSDPFEKYSVQEFYSKYRFTPHCVKNILLPMLDSDLKKPTRRGLPFSPEVMLLITLRYFATGSFQKLHGDIMEIRQQSVSRIIVQVSTLLAIKMRRFVKFPDSTEDRNKVKQKFYEIAQFPGVLGCIDSTHVKIKSPGGTSSVVFRNRKGWFSINVQAVIGPNQEFFDFVARWPGSTHESFIFDNSVIKQRLSTGILEGILLGDNRYPVSNVLLTPFLTPNSASEELYNKCHIETRNSVDNVLGIWKRKFACLQVGMGVKLDTIVAIICACAMLHNISLKLDDTMPSDYTNDCNKDTVDPVPMPENPDSDGFMIRQSIVERFFSDTII